MVPCLYTSKKRDNNFAVPLVEALVLPFIPNSNTEPTYYAYIFKVRIRVHAYTHRRHLCVAVFRNVCEIYQISTSQNKALKTLYHHVIAFLRCRYQRLGTSVRTLCDCKGTTKKWHMQIICHFFNIFFTFFIKIAYFATFWGLIPRKFACMFARSDEYHLRCVRVVPASASAFRMRID